MAEPKGAPSAWIGQQVHLEFDEGESMRGTNCKLDDENERGVTVSDEDGSYFYPWGRVMRIALGHLTPRRRQITRVVR
jgi:hypothetical protein